MSGRRGKRNSGMVNRTVMDGSFSNLQEEVVERMLMELPENDAPAPALASTPATALVLPVRRGNRNSGRANCTFSSLPEEVLERMLKELPENDAPVPRLASAPVLAGQGGNRNSGRANRTAMDGSFLNLQEEVVERMLKELPENDAPVSRLASAPVLAGQGGNRNSGKANRTVMDGSFTNLQEEVWERMLKEFPENDAPAPDLALAPATSPALPGRRGKRNSGKANREVMDGSFSNLQEEPASATARIRLRFALQEEVLKRMIQDLPPTGKAPCSNLADEFFERMLKQQQSEAASKTHARVRKTRKTRKTRKPTMTAIRKRRIRGVAATVKNNVTRPRVKYTTRRIRLDDIDAIESRIVAKRKQRDNWKKIICEVLDDRKRKERRKIIARARAIAKAKTLKRMSNK